MRSRTYSRRGSAATILLSVLFVALVTVSVGSTVVALRTMKERDKARQNFELANAALERSAKAIASGKRSNEQKEQLRPMIEYYEKFAQTYAKDPDMLPEVTEAEFRMAGLRAKVGMKESLDALRYAIGHLGEMNRANIEPERFPSFSACALNMATPNEWLMTSGASFDSLAMYGPQLFLTMQGVTGQLDDLHKRYPQAVVFREDLAAVRRAAGSLLTAAPGRKAAALEMWLKARDLLESLAREQPANEGYKTQLVESLTAAGDLQVGEKQADKAIANYKRAIEISEQLVQAKPDDKPIAQGLEKAKKGLAKAESAAGAAAEKAEAKAEGAAEKTDDAQAAVPGAAQ